jgi:hypothetical protein
MRHPGTLGQSLMASMFVDTVNDRFGAGITPLSAREVLEFTASLGTSPPRDTARLATLGRDPIESGDVRGHEVTTVPSGRRGR